MSEPSFLSKVFEYFKYFLSKVFSVSGVTILLSVIGLVFASVAMSKVKSASTFDNNLYLDRLYRSTIQLLVISIIGLLVGIMFITGKFECHGIYNPNSESKFGKFLGKTSPSWVMLLICLYILSLSADMVNSYQKLTKDSQDNTVILSSGFVLAFACLSVVLAGYFIYKSNKEETSTATSFDLYSNYIMY